MKEWIFNSMKNYKNFNRSNSEPSVVKMVVSFGICFFLSIAVSAQYTDSNKNWETRASAQERSGGAKEVRRRAPATRGMEWRGVEGPKR